LTLLRRLQIFIRQSFAPQVVNEKLQKPAGRGDLPFRQQINQFMKLFLRWHISILPPILRQRLRNHIQPDPRLLGSDNLPIHHLVHLLVPQHLRPRRPLLLRQ
jgi:hypothetical protein